MINRTLFNISEDMAALDALLEEVGGDVSDESAEAAIDQWIKDNANDLNAKLDDYGNLIKFRESLSKWRQEEAKRFTGLARTDDNIVSSLKTRLLLFMHNQNKKKIETDRFKFWWQKNGNRGVEYEPEIWRKLDGPVVYADIVPEQYRVSVKIDLLNTEKLRADLERLEALRDERDRIAIEAEVEFSSQLQAEIIELENLTSFAKLNRFGTHLRIK